MVRSSMDHVEVTSIGHHSALLTVYDAATGLACELRVPLALLVPSDQPVRLETPDRTLLLPREVVDREQWRYTCLDENGNQACPNASYGQVLQYQRPMMARLGVLVDFGRIH